MELSNFSHITILLADDHPLFRKGLKTVLKRLHFNGVILEAGNGRDVLELSRKHTVALHILDYSMPLLNGYEAAKIILREQPKSRIIMMSMYNEPELITSFYDIGIWGYLDKNSEVDQIQEVFIKALNKGDLFNPFDQGYVSSAHKAVNFTTREMELIELLCQGFTTQDISKALSLTPKTVETYRCRLLDKANVKNTSELLRYVHRIGIID